MNDRYKYLKNSYKDDDKDLLKIKMSRDLGNEDYNRLFLLALRDISLTLALIYDERNDSHKEL